MSREIDDVVRAHEAARVRLHTLADHLDDRRWAAKPAADRWSVAECVEHLNLTSRAFLPLLENAVASAPPRSSALRMDATGRFIGVMAGPLLRLGGWRFGRTRTTAPFVPPSAPDRAPTLIEFDRLQESLIVLARSAEGRAIDKVKISSPFDARLTYSAYSAMVIIPRHQQRHLDQADEAIRRLPGGRS